VAEPGGGKIMLGFLVRRCANAIGHDPSADEFAAWANSFREQPWDRPTYLFGRPISVAEAEVILRNPGRMVRTRLTPPEPAEGCQARECSESGGRVVVLRPLRAVPNAQQK
jgi:hypothetical protein